MNANNSRKQQPSPAEVHDLFAFIGVHSRFLGFKAPPFRSVA
jgi:hypothetical protein